MSDMPASQRTDYKLEVVTLPVSDVDKAAEFYVRQVGFTLDGEVHPVPGFRYVQLTPPGSACSLQVGTGITDAVPGTARSTYLIVADIEAACRDLAGRGVKVGGIRHKHPADVWEGTWAPGPDPGRRDYASAADFADPDGNTWIIQEVGYRPPSFGSPPAQHRGGRGRAASSVRVVG
ncbi:MAG TPA: VOC family protein [Trebonia sp.]|jgi:catechol 2,3-dioxygenase-like lactoylglutathione lyase family enzyme